ncbi:concanavalin A-like lectin/glucanase domain-containing protein [Lasiosphaeris hirsuta]|uniref:Concanavalin A-like lectin/glucanase domain-containing protein n=1 Tax=Lasiosphaeris hirsuta TaxID=260670 RepID=A0AA40DRQ9_9PEZI|nr:concanavalin A-like lectin/glucanase domain-containing protein [Lasiosphaeris hirsuta]
MCLGEEVAAGSGRRHQSFVSITRFLSCLLLLPAFVSADCECGYSTNIAPNSQPHQRRHQRRHQQQEQHVFTDLIESDFTSLGDIAANTDWARQEFNVTQKQARGDYGEMFSVANIPGFGQKKLGAVDPGLHLVVGSEPVQSMIPVAEIDTQRLDVSWGTFRASMKVTGVPGTCAAFFWYFNDTQEIDMEFLSKDFNATNSSYPINLVLQSREAATDGYNAAQTGHFVKAYLPFNPTTAFHEYRIDYLPGRVYFYADGALLAEMQGPAVPVSPGHLILQHWSNGNPFWSGGPPTQDAVLTVEYVKAYFNSSMPERQKDWTLRCKDPAAPGAVCAIPELTAKERKAADWFFVEQKNMTNNQTVYTPPSKGARGYGGGRWTTAGAMLMAGGAVFVLL